MTVLSIFPPIGWKGLQRFRECRLSLRLGLGKVLSRFLGSWINLHQPIDLRQLQDTANHSGDTRKAQGASGNSQARQAVHDFSDATAVDFGDS